MRAEQNGIESPTDSPRPSSPSTDDVIVRADEVDEAGANRPQRPILRREGSAPPPPPRQPPPPAPPAQDDGQASESLTLAQLRNLVTSLPKLEPKAYAYTYDETRTFPEELEEWFQYTEEDRALWETAKVIFHHLLTRYETGEAGGAVPSWGKLPQPRKEGFVRELLEVLKEIDDVEARTQCAFALAHVAMGSWHESGRMKGHVSSEEAPEFEAPNDKYQKTAAQLRSIREGCELLAKLGAASVFFTIIKQVCDL